MACSSLVAAHVGDYRGLCMPQNDHKYKPVLTQICLILLSCREVSISLWVFGGLLINLLSSDAWLWECLCLTSLAFYHLLIFWGVNWYIATGPMNCFIDICFLAPRTVKTISQKISDSHLQPVKKYRSGPMLVVQRVDNTTSTGKIAIHWISVNMKQSLLSAG